MLYSPAGVRESQCVNIQRIRSPAIQKYPASFELHSHRRRLKERERRTVVKDTRKSHMKDDRRKARKSPAGENWLIVCTVHDEVTIQGYNGFNLYKACGQLRNMVLDSEKESCVQRTVEKFGTSVTASTAQIPDKPLNP
ncbi:hypothetical protein PoB_000260100 [Plakobranchus ocellatus]|uniref:Uncharacterized protein n=1 Tax=Plakobranchus ocellatus TaxID=259542 RepID=A0AAV3XZ47_9GAST|nr:hypothetical protein PoB_000260100 [Plakobranchus ocellatus]